MDRGTHAALYRTNVPEADIPHFLQECRVSWPVHDQWLCRDTRRSGPLDDSIDASEVVREALRLLEEHDQVRAGQLAEFNQELGRRLASIDRGGTVKPAEARARLERKAAQRRKPQA
jgi:Arc/MetJ-type ribon-helix-helix transcriptional regulator